MRNTFLPFRAHFKKPMTVFTFNGIYMGHPNLRAKFLNKFRYLNEFGFDARRHIFRIFKDLFIKEIYLPRHLNDVIKIDNLMQVDLQLFFQKFLEYRQLPILSISFGSNALEYAANSLEMPVHDHPQAGSLMYHQYQCSAVSQSRDTAGSFG